ncbi:hypothetical protein CUJ84_Chr002251 [Rhizobium leguminosarum]|uniref:Uncharacterized protein n=1 Tax=Rhizobium leguminosarum TaxID=384 RepID=A0A2K9Z301_RHILE|nr:hypothetical protein CUJ84_Chr002251 [Rhizobium leguminosarum]
MRDIPYSTLAGFFHACRNVAGSTIGSFKRKLKFSGKHDIVPEIETIKIKDVNEAYERVLKSDLRYHFLKDMTSIA